MECRSDWTREEIRSLHDSPLLDLVYKAASVHRKHHTANQVQICSLISIKTGGCPEDCKYCPQSSLYQTHVEATPLMQNEEILSLAKDAIAQGATRVCLGAAWRKVRDGEQFNQILEVVKKIAEMGAEVCCTLGMLNASQAEKLKSAGLYAYNHNLDTSPEFYSSIITTRSYEDRLNTLDTVEKAGISVCCGGIIGMGERIEDRIDLLHALASRKPHPASVPINLLTPVKGTPLGTKKRLPIWDLVRMVATARMIMPKAIVRLSAGRLERSIEEQALCFLAGANSIHSGEKLLTCPNPHFDQDQNMMQILGLQGLRR
ncbi:MAG: biotin synthase BioB [Verrucomicrobia bacterium]|nr:biotin synthase BioB [Verrucomicrobiota bacterium]